MSISEIASLTGLVSRGSRRGELGRHIKETVLGLPWRVVSTEPVYFTEISVTTDDLILFDPALARENRFVLQQAVCLIEAGDSRPLLAAIFGNFGGLSAILLRGLHPQKKVVVPRDLNLTNNIFSFAKEEQWLAVENSAMATNVTIEKIV